MAQIEQEFPLTGQVIIDGIEGQWARVELPDGTTADWSLASLPADVHEGDVVSLQVEGGDLEIAVDHEATQQRKQQAQQRLDALNAHSPQGEINL